MSIASLHHDCNVHGHLYETRSIRPDWYEHHCDYCDHRIENDRLNEHDREIERARQRRRAK
jgi:hypothetical protein